MLICSILFSASNPKPQPVDKGSFRPVCFSEILLSLGVSDSEPHEQGICESDGGEDHQVPHPASLGCHRTENQGCGGSSVGKVLGTSMRT